MAQGLAERMALCLQLLARRPVLVPRLRKLACAVADGFEPRFAIDKQTANDAPRYTDPLIARRGHYARHLVVAALRFADFRRHIAHIDQALDIELRPVVESTDDVGASSRLDCRGGARLQIVGVDRLDIELDAERLGAF